MTAARSLVAACAMICALCSPAMAQEAATAKKPVQPTTKETPAEAQVKDGEPKVQYTVIEDDATRIEELKVRGQTQRMTVTPKGLKSYEILPADQGRDMSDSAGSQRGAAGKRVWRILTF